MEKAQEPYELGSASSNEYYLTIQIKYPNDTNGENLRSHGEIISSAGMKYFFMKGMNNSLKHESRDKGLN
jgi:hypothetical protein